MALEFCFLCDREEALPTVARWYFEQWGQYSEGETLSRSEQNLRQYLQSTALPFIRLACIEGKVVGAAQLKYREMPKHFPDYEHWLGGVYMDDSYRGRGLGKLMVQDVLELAPEFGVEQLYLQTEILDGGMYTSLGWQSLERVQHSHGVEVVVMRRRMEV